MNKTILCLGDSITDCERLESPDGLGFGYVHLLAEKAAPKTQFINRGVNGFTIARLLEQCRREAGQFSPALITVLIGVNDVSLIMEAPPERREGLLSLFFDRYQELLTLLLSQAPEQILLMEPFLFPYPREFVRWLPWISRISQGIRRLAPLFSAEFLPLQAPLSQLAARLGFPAVTTDGVHLTEAGHALLARELMSVSVQPYW